MTRDDFIRMAQECQLIGMRPHLDGIYEAALERFAEIVEAQARAEERKACAESVELARVHQYVWYPEDYHVKANDVDNIYKFQHERCMEAIRARGKK